MTNLERKARCYESDLRFLLSLLPEGSQKKWEINALIRTLKEPTNEKINAAWRIAAIIHEEIRKQ